MIKSALVSMVTLLIPVASLAADNAARSYLQDKRVADDISAAADAEPSYKPQAARAGTISPSGNMLAFRKNIAGVPQLWAVPASGGTPKQLTFGGAVSDFYWTPGSDGLVYVAEAPGDELAGLAYISADGATARALEGAGQAFANFGGFASDGSALIFSTTERNGTDYDLYVQEMSGGQARQVYQGKSGWLAQAWQPGGDYVIVTQTRSEDACDLYVFNIKTQTMIPVYRPEVAANFGAFEWTMDGKGFYFKTNLEREYQNLAYYDITTGELEFIETPAADIEAVSLGGSDRYLAWSVRTDDVSRLNVRDLQTKTMVNLPKLPEGVYGIELADEAPVLSISITSPNISGDIWVYNLKEETLARATNAAAAVLAAPAIDELGDDLASVQSQALAVEAARQKAKDDAQAAAALAVAQARADKATADLNAKEAALAGATEKLEAAEKAIKGYDQTIKAAQRKAEKAQKRLIDAQAMLDEAQATLADTTDALANVQSERADAQAEQLAAQSSLDAATAAAADAMAALKTAKQGAMAASDAPEDGQSFLEKAKGLVKEAIDTVTDAAQ